MKKFLSVLMALIMALTCFSFTMTANADELEDYLNFLTQLTEMYDNAPNIEWNNDTNRATMDVSINSQSSTLSEYISINKFVAPVSGWYEVALDNTPSTGVISIFVEPDDEDDETYSIDGQAGSSVLGAIDEGYLFTGAKFVKDHTYYVLVQGSETAAYSGTITIKKGHTHDYEDPYTEAAYYEYDEYWEEVLSWDGAKTQECKHCGYTNVVETYYAPKTMTLSYTTATYSNEAKKPKVTVKDRKGNVISSSNYKVTYKNNINPGKATVTVTFNGKKYDGVMTKTFTIKPKKATISSVKSNKSKQITVKWGRDYKASGYEVRYSTSSKFSSSTTKKVTINGSSTVSKTISNLKGGKKYYVQVRAYKTVDGKKIYGSWSSTKSVTTKK